MAVGVEAGAEALTLSAERIVDGTFVAHLRCEHVLADPLSVSPDEIAATVARATVATCAQMLGVIERLLADTLEYVKTRKQFGVAIGSFQTVQHRMARLYVIAGQCRSAILAAALGEAGDRNAWLRAVAAARASVSEQALHVAHECVQFHGGIGITQELAISRGHKQLLVLSRQFGTAAEARRTFDRLAG
ncbi:MAG: hypothetical protein K0B16_17385 [Burkholderiaceae bacterium]|nr:hypothetical protein [Burkholderiaceae bacterium]